MSRSLIIIVLFGMASLHLFAQVPEKIATDYEWQLTQPGRTLFRDKVPVGQIGFVAGKKEKATGEALQVLTDIAFTPGDSTRYFAVTFRVMEGDRLYGEVILDADELPELIKSARYLAATALDIAATERAETDITFRSRAGLSLEFRQVGQQQQLQLALPDPLSDGEIIRPLTSDQYSLFADLLDLAIYELNRQGANIRVKSNK
ncbi:MAG: hypothetical protein IPG71_01970 [bacterium]|nr:hypothetical protein [bacterium]